MTTKTGSWLKSNILSAWKLYEKQLSGWKNLSERLPQIYEIINTINVLTGLQAKFENSSVVKMNDLDITLSELISLRNNTDRFIFDIEDLIYTMSDGEEKNTIKQSISSAKKNLHNFNEAIDSIYTNNTFDIEEDILAKIESII